jgi:4-amino-4-deoxy-L-arabinose transferase-like glycosyltransferase
VKRLYQASQGEHNLVVQPKRRQLRDDIEDQPMATRQADLSTTLKAGSKAGASARANEPLQASPYGMLLAIALAMMLIVRLVALKFNATDLFFDEAQYWSWSLEPAFGYYSKPPLIAWLIGASTAVCGVSEFCIRLPSPLVHTATAVVIYLLGARLYSAQVGFWSALAFATLPGVSFSAGIISTDVPLLFTWALALLGFVALLDTKAWWPVALIALGLGLGLNAKYAMAYFVLSVGFYVLVTPEKRAVLRDIRLWTALALGVAMIAPNLLWNASNKFATFAHTADNAKLGGSLVHPLKALEFLGTQFGVFGPILFGSLIAILCRAYYQGLDGRDRMLLCFTVPVIAVVTVLAFLSRAHANWAAVSYVAATVLVIATLIRDASPRGSIGGWLKASMAIHLLLLGLVALGTSTAGQIKLPANADPLARTLGWRAVADATRAELAKAKASGKPYASIITDERALSAELLYYMREEATPLLAWRATATPADHYELTRPFTPTSPQPVLLVAMRRDATPITKWFNRAEKLSDHLLPAGATAKRAIAFYALDGYKK